jgi:hypothetical protein
MPTLRSGVWSLAALMWAGSAQGGELINASVRGKKGHARVDLRKMKPHAALVEFKFDSWTDRKLHALVVRGVSGGAYFEATDKYGPKQRVPYNASARWMLSPALRGRTTTVRRRCTTRCVLPLPRTDGYWVLSGFSFRRPGRKESHIARIAVRPDASGRNVEVIFKDKGRDIDFDVRVDLVSIPKRLVSRAEVVSGRASGKDRDLTAKMGKPRRGNDYSLLRGFDVRFLNSDHKFRLLAVKTARRSTREVLFWDSKPDDPFEARLHLVYAPRRGL